VRRSGGEDPRGNLAAYRGVTCSCASPKTEEGGNTAFHAGPGSNQTGVLGCNELDAVTDDIAETGNAQASTGTTLFFQLNRIGKTLRQAWAA